VIGRSSPRQPWDRRVGLTAGRGIATTTAEISVAEGCAATGASPPPGTHNPRNSVGTCDSWIAGPPAGERALAVQDYPL
jgi:hypothetical protein